MSSAICQNFVQNAWKKELCSNCFKSKDEHVPLITKPKKILLISNRTLAGIIRDPKKLKPKHKVEFTTELSQFIGYGGEDWLSTEELTNGEGEEIDDDDIQEIETINEDYLVTDSDEDELIKEIRRETKKNTNFNTVSLGEFIEEKKTYAHLKLGKPLVDSDGKKQTLLVSVTPFGEDNSRKYNNSNNNAKNMSYLPVLTKTNKDTKNNNVILTNYLNKTEDENSVEKEEKSLLDEISETLEKSDNPIQIFDKRKTSSPSSLKDSSEESSSDKENINTNIKDAKKETENNKTERRISLTRTPALKGRDLEKPIIYQTSTAKIELLNSRNLKLSKPNGVNTNKGISKQQEMNNNKLEGTLSKEDQKLFNDIVSSSNFIKNEINSNISQLTQEKNDQKSAGDSEKTTPAKKYNNPSSPPHSREQAGKPDGREDPEETAETVPALPLTPPPPLENQPSFLHSHSSVSLNSSSLMGGIHYPPIIHEKPKVPSKPSTVIIRKPATTSTVVPNQSMTTFSKEPLVKQDSLSDSDAKGNKRRAPNPPDETCVNVNVPNLLSPNMGASVPFTRNSMVLSNGSGGGELTPPPKGHGEKAKMERNERASSCTPKMYNVRENANNTSESIYQVPSPIPRKIFSLSTDNLVSTPDEKRKEKSKGRFSLRKFLRMGSSKDSPRLTTNNSISEDMLNAPKPKPRLVIVHPSELNGSKVEVVAKADQVDNTSTEKTERSSLRTSKPPPPPRNYDNWKPPISSPPPPKSMEVLTKQRALSRSSSSSSTTKSKTETVYANIGEVRSSIVPNKPVRTASMREREAQQQQQSQIMLQKKNIYEPIGNSRLKTTEHVYDYVTGSSNRSSSPSSDSSGKNSPKTKNIRLNKRSESSIDVSGEYFKDGALPRSMSLTYCGSETESEIYSPYSFYGSESEVTEDDHDWIQNGRTHKLRSRKGRSIVHKTLEDNYGAVIVANHEALAQVLENIQQAVYVLPALRGLKLCSNLRLTEFSLKSGVPPVHVGSRTFHQALWGAHHVTLMFGTGISATSSTMNLSTFNLNSVTEFSDLIPKELLTGKKEEGNKQLQATVAVLPWLQIHTIESYSELLRNKSNQEEMWKDGFFVLLQLVNALKMLQAQGIEELPLSLNSFMLCKDMDRGTHHRLCILQSAAPELATIGNQPEEKYGTLCMCAARAIAILQPPLRTTRLIQSLLNNERSVSLTQAKAVLEFSLWGPSDVSLGSSVKERELTLQRWLDLQRATVLHGLVCARVQLTVYEECHLLFLVRSNARMMSDASMLIESNNLRYSHASKA